MSTIPRWIEWLLLVVAVALSAAAGLPESVIAGWGIDQGFVVGMLIILILIGLVRYGTLALVLTVVVLAFGANLPAGVADRMGIAPEAMLMALIAVVGLSAINEFTNWLPKGLTSEVGAQRRQTEALLGAIYNMNVHEVDLLLREGVRANVRSKTNRTPLMIAVALGSRPIVRLLMRYNADVHAKDDEGETALTIAKRRGLTEVAEDLVRAGAMQ
ncbi:MAG: hypothetical protein MAG794_01028 [Gammaproteobacteria bacterium]|nr:hypothetical protein [Gammaproteobacteria bacterium]